MLVLGTAVLSFVGALTGGFAAARGGADAFGGAGGAEVFGTGGAGPAVASFVSSSRNAS